MARTGHRKKKRTLPRKLPVPTVVPRDPEVEGLLRSYAAAFGLAVRRYSQDRFGARAQAIAYGVLFSLIPLAATAVSLFGLVLRDEAIRARVFFTLIDALAVVTGRTGLVYDTIEGLAHSSPALGPVSLAATLWTVLRTAGLVRQALEDAWRHGHSSPFLHHRLTEVSLLGIVSVLMLASIVPSAAFALFITLGLDRFGPVGPWLRVLAGLGTLALGLALSISVFVLTYRFVPRVGQSWQAALVGGIPAGVAFEALKVGFSVFVTRFAAANPVYGALSSVFLFLVWANAAATIFLMGAEVTVIWEQSSQGRQLEAVSIRTERRLRRLLRRARSSSSPSPVRMKDEG